MILRKIVLMWILILLFLSFQPIKMKIEEARASSTFIVTDGTPDYVAVENPYYICNISGNLGQIKEFYIKSYTTINIVSHTSGFQALGGHEESNWYNSTYETVCSQWSGYSKESCTLSIVKQTSDYVTIKAVVDFGGYSEATERYYLEMLLVSYRTFYADKPYYKVTYSKIFQEDLNQPWNPQTCFLFDFDWWNRIEDPNASWTINATGGVRHGINTYDVFWNCAPHYGKLPWYLVTNSTLGNSYGIILLDAFPVPGEVQMGAEAGGTYSEFQIDHNWGGEAVEAPDCVSYLAVANATDDYQYIDQLATDLWLGLDPVPIDNDEVFLATKANDRVQGGYYGYATVGRTLLYDAWVGTYGPEFPVSGCRNLGKKTNASGTYQLYKVADVNIAINKYNASYASESYWGDFENELRWNHTFEYWCDSDAIKYTYTVTTLKAVNITDLKLWHYPYLRSRSLFESEPSLAKYNRSLANFYTDEGWFIKNVTHPREHSSNYWECNVIVDNDNDVEYPNGTSWTCIRYFQPFRVYEWQDEDEFSLSNYHDPEDKFVDYSWNVHYWLPMPLLSQEGNLRLIQTSGFNATHIGCSSLADDTLTIDLFGESGETSTYQLYCGDKGQPKDVSGVSSWDYDSVTEILTLTVIHNGPTTITISWAAEPVTATVDIDPGTLNLKSKGKWITAHIELPEDYDVNDIDVSTVRLNGEIQAELHPTKIGDYDADGVSDLMVRFDRQDVIALLSVGEATLTITGKINETPFEGIDTIRVTN